MATWHQQRAGNDRPISGETWSVFTNPPNEPCSSMSGFASEGEAEQYINNLAKHHPTKAKYSRVVSPRM